MQILGVHVKLENLGCIFKGLNGVCEMYLMIVTLGV